ncbi:MAG: acyl-CoA dehydratase activase [bacterium]
MRSITEMNINNFNCELNLDISKKIYIGIDLGSVSIKIVLISENEEIIYTDYMRTKGRVIDSVKKIINRCRKILKNNEIGGCCTTGSGRKMAAVILSADLEKNEITTHSTAALKLRSDIRTILEIGGEDSKIILLEDGIATDFAMNTICAAGTGAFLDQVAARLEIPVAELGALALKSRQDVIISGRCTVFAESDIIFKQQVGYRVEDIIRGLCRAMVSNYLNDVAKGKEIKEPVFFQGGVAANQGIRESFSQLLGCEIIVPDYYREMGAYGAALMARRMVKGKSKMKSIDEIYHSDFSTSSFVCKKCDNTCEVIKFFERGLVQGYLGGRCERWK